MRLYAYYLLLRCNAIACIGVVVGLCLSDVLFLCGAFLFYEASMMLRENMRLRNINKALSDELSEKSSE